MIRYFVRRIVTGLLTIFILVTIVFFLMKILPGSPFDSDSTSDVVTDPRVIAIIEREYHLDKPALVQYGLYLKGLLHGDLGYSFKKAGIRVADIVWDLAPVTMKLGAVAFAVSLLLGLSLGICAALTRFESLRALIVALATVGISVPGFLLAIFLIYFFAVQMKWLPIIGLKSWQHFVMPALALSFYPIAYISRLVRSTLTEALTQDYIVMAKSKGLSYGRIVLEHALPNTLIPVITYLGPLIASLMTGSFVVENIFAIPGIGREMVQAIQGRDYSVILGMTIFIGSFVISMNILADILLAFVDPRIRFES